jgi:hypothetical protein
MRLLSLACGLLLVTGCASTGPRCGARLQPINAPAVSAVPAASTVPAANTVPGGNAATAAAAPRSSP